MRMKEELIRFSASPLGSLIIDLEGRGGRGAYLCPRQACLEVALKRRRFQQTLKAELKLPPREVILETIRLEVVRKVSSLLGLARRARKLAIGPRAAEGALQGGAARLLLLASNAAERDLLALQAEAAKRGVPTFMFLSREELQEALGREGKAVVVKDPHFARGILQYVGKLPEGGGAAGGGWAEDQVGGR